MKVLITGGSGFVGSNLINVLKRDKTKEILSIDKKHSHWHDEITKQVNIVDENAMDQIDFVADTIIHLAAEHRDDVYPKSLYDEVNVQGTEHIIRYAEAQQSKTIIFFSSVAVSGFAEVGTGECVKVNPFNDYGRTQWVAEQKLRKWYESAPNERKLIIVRPTVIFGPRNRGNFFNLINQVNNNKFLMVGAGGNKKSLAYIGNIIEFVSYCITLPAGNSYLYNYVDQPESDMNHIIETIYKGLNKSMPSIRIPYFVAYAGAMLFDITAKFTRKNFPISCIRIKKFCANTSFNTSLAETGFKAPHSVEDAIIETVKYEFKNLEKDNVVFYTE